MRLIMFFSFSKSYEGMEKCPRKDNVIEQPWVLHKRSTGENNLSRDTNVLYKQPKEKHCEIGSESKLHRRECV
jgi:hypothetical protein